MKTLSKSINGMSTYEHFHDTLHKIQTHNTMTPIIMKMKTLSASRKTSSTDSDEQSGVLPPRGRAPRGDPR